MIYRLRINYYTQKLPSWMLRSTLTRLLYLTMERGHILVIGLPVLWIHLYHDRRITFRSITIIVEPRIDEQLMNRECRQVFGWEERSFRWEWVQCRVSGVRWKKYSACIEQKRGQNQQSYWQFCRKQLLEGLSSEECWRKPSRRLGILKSDIVFINDINDDIPLFNLITSTAEDLGRVPPPSENRKRTQANFPERQYLRLFLEVVFQGGSKVQRLIT